MVLRSVSSKRTSTAYVEVGKLSTRFLLKALQKVESLWDARALTEQNSRGKLQEQGLDKCTCVRWRFARVSFRFAHWKYLFPHNSCFSLLTLYQQKIVDSLMLSMIFHCFLYEGERDAAIRIAFGTGPIDSHSQLSCMTAFDSDNITK